jgi:hypothetical protein
MFNPTQQIEDGMDRLAELRLLPEIKNKGVVGHHLTNSHLQHQFAKQVELNDEWEAFRVTFSIFHPQDVAVRLSGSRPEIGDWEKATGQLTCHRSHNARKWMYQQYGTQMKPYEATAMLRHSR